MGLLLTLEKHARLTQFLKIIKFNVNITLELPSSDGFGADRSAFHLNLSFQKAGNTNTNGDNGVLEGNASMV